MPAKKYDSMADDFKELQVEKEFLENKQGKRKKRGSKNLEKNDSKAYVMEIDRIF